jgi:hypothetical protein
MNAKSSRDSDVADGSGGAVTCQVSGTPAVQAAGVSIPAECKSGLDQNRTENKEASGALDRDPTRARRSGGTTLLTPPNPPARRSASGDSWYRFGSGSSPDLSCGAPGCPARRHDRTGHDALRRRPGGNPVTPSRATCDDRHGAGCCHPRHRFRSERRAPRAAPSTSTSNSGRREASGSASPLLGSNAREQALGLPDNRRCDGAAAPIVE